MSRRAGLSRVVRLMGPAFVAAVAYVDPGNVAANISAGSRYGYLLVWILVVSNLMAMLVQYLSATVGLVTGASLPQLVAGRLGRRARLAYWLQAEIVAAATDLAEIIGGALALNLLFGLPLLWGGLITGAVALAILSIHSPERQHLFTGVVLGLLLVITIGFLAGLLVAPVDPAGLAAGLIPGFSDGASVFIAASMVGATVMPHAIYLHSGLSAQRSTTSASRLRQLMHANRWDVVGSLLLAGSVNIGLLVLAAASLRGVPGTDTIQGAHDAITAHLGGVVGVIFAIGLLASGLASSSVGAYSGDMIMEGLLHVRMPRVWRRAITLVPGVVVLALGAEPTAALVVSQALLSLGIPFALVPLVRLTSDAGLMGEWVNPRWMRLIAWLVAALIIALNLALLGVTLTGAA